MPSATGCGQPLARLSWLGHLPCLGFWGLSLVLVWLSVVLKPPDEFLMNFLLRQSQNGLQLATSVTGAPGPDVEIMRAVSLGARSQEGSQFRCVPEWTTAVDNRLSLTTGQGGSVERALATVLGTRATGAFSHFSHSHWHGLAGRVEQALV